MIKTQALEIPEVIKIRTPRYSDERGFFAPVYNQVSFEKAGLPAAFMEDYHSLSIQPGTVRGLHYQMPPHGQAKLVRVISGRIFDVVLDIRQSSPTFGRHVSAELGSGDDEWVEQLYIPEGFAHGFCVLEPDTQIIYKVTNLFAPDYQYGILWNDPGISIDWPLGNKTPLLSEKDRKHPPLKQQKYLFA